MKSILTRLLTAVAAFAGLVSTASANLPYSNGDLLLGFRATADPGSTQDYVVNLGPVSQFTQASGPVTVSGLGNIAADLAIYETEGESTWNSRAEVFWGIVGTDAAGDPANTLYATRPRANAATPADAWVRRVNSSQSTTNSIFRSFISGYTLSDANATSPKGTKQSTGQVNHYSSFTSPAVDFGFFAGIEGNFGSGTANSVLDLFRLTPTQQAAGKIWVGSFQLDDSGVLTFTPAPPTVPNFKLSNSTYSVGEEAGTVTISVLRGGLTTGADTVLFTTSDGSAHAGTDYTAKTGFSVPFAANETQKDVTVDIASIPNFQGGRSFNVALSSPSNGGELFTPYTAVVNIAESTPADFGDLAFSAATYELAPVNGNAAPNKLTVTLSRTSGTDGAVSVDVAVTGGSLTAPGDFTALAAPTTISFTAGQTTKTFDLQLLAIADTKLPGTIQLALSNPTGGAALGAVSTATVTVTKADKVKPSFKLTSKSGKVTLAAFNVAGSAKDNAGISRVEVKVNGGSAQLASLGAFSNGSLTFNLNGLPLENGLNSLVVTAFDSSGNAAKSTTLKVTYVNNRPATVGAYNGLLTAVSGPVNNSTGFVTVNITPTGLFTGKVTIGAAVLTIKGLFDNAGNAHFNVKGNTTDAATTLALSKKIGLVTTQFGNLALALAPDKVTGTLKDAGAAVVANINTDHAGFDGKTPATSPDAYYLANKGSYTVIFPARNTQAGLSAADYPQGDGSATLKVSAKGVVTLKGTLADGTPITAAAPLSKTYVWPFFAKLYKSLGVITGPVAFDQTKPLTDLLGTDVVWIRPPTTAKWYPTGWSAGILTDLSGARYASVAGTSVLPGLGPIDLQAGNANLQFTDGKLTGPVNHTVSIAPTNKVTNAPADKTFTLKITAATGLIAGKFKHTDNTSPAFKGAIFQKGANAGGFGFFLSTPVKNGPTGESGAVTLDAK